MAELDMLSGKLNRSKPADRNRICRHCRPTRLIIVPVRNTVLFPGLVLPITVGRAKSIAAAQQAVRDQRQVGILLQRDGRHRRPDPDRHAPHGYGRQHRALRHRRRTARIT